MKDDPSVCTCGCHEKPPRLIHVMACCQPCKRCGQRIKNGRDDEHAGRCPKKPAVP